jgi:hypothetical protein
MLTGTNTAMNCDSDPYKDTNRDHGVFIYFFTELRRQPEDLPEKKNAHLLCN